MKVNMLVLCAEVGYWGDFLLSLLIEIVATFVGAGLALKMSNNHDNKEDKKREEERLRAYQENENQKRLDIERREEEKLCRIASALEEELTDIYNVIRSLKDKDYPSKFHIISWDSMINSGLFLDMMKLDKYKKYLKIYKILIDYNKEMTLLFDGEERWKYGKTKAKEIKEEIEQLIEGLNGGN